MKILAKLLLGFLAVAALCGVVGIVGVTRFGVLIDDLERIQTETIPSITTLYNLRGEVLKIKSAVRSVVNPLGAGNPEFLKRQKDNFDAAREAQNKHIEEFEKIQMVEEEEKLWEATKEHLAKAKAYNDSIWALIGQSEKTEDPEVRAAIYAQLFEKIDGAERTIFDDYIASLQKVIDYDVAHYGNELVDESQTEAVVGRTTLILVTVLSFLVALALGILLGTSISRSLRKAVAVLDKLAEGNIGDRLEVKSKDEFRQVAASLNLVADTIQALIADMNHMSSEHDAGDIDVKLDEGRFKGAYKEMATGVNTMVFGHIAVKKKAMACIAEFSRGNFEAPLEKFPGKKAFINDNVELLRTNLKNLIADANMLSQAALEGRLQTRAEASKHQGDFRKIVEGVNQTLDLVITPINETISILKHMAEGDLTASMTGDYKGDFDVLKKALTDSLESINELLGQVNIAVDQVASGSVQVSQASQALSQGATEQASSLEEITSSITEVASQTKQNTESAIQVNGLAKTAKDDAEQGNQQMKDLVAAMNDINQSAEEIRKIVKAIDDISFQINLLALNANVEAARAGKYGKGFAVVAEEVRNLAVRSASSVKDTTRMVDEAIGNIEKGNALVDVTAKQLTSIVDGAAKVAVLAEEVATAGKEQSQGLEQITLGLNQIDQVTQSNTASAEESASASEELSSQAQQVKAMLGRFKLRASDKNLNNAEMIQMLKNELARQGGGRTAPALSIAPRAAEPAKAKKPALAAARLNPAEVIALDDDNFGKF